MKRFFLFLPFSFYIFNSAFSQNPLVKQWDYRFGGSLSDQLYTFQQTADGGYILGGISTSAISGDKTQAAWNNSVDYWIVKVDSNGTKQWDKDFGGIGNDFFYSLQQTDDGGYILGGSSGSGIGGHKTQANWGGEDYWIVKTDSLGNKQWDKDFGGSSDEHFTSLQQTLDGGYIIGGWSFSNISGNKTQTNWDPSTNSADYWIIKTDSLGNIQWDKDFGGISNDGLYSLKQTIDGGYILGGSSSSPMSGDKTQNTWGGAGDYDYWIVKLDSLGVKQWDKDYGGTDDDEFYCLQTTSDGGYVLGGLSRSAINGDKTQANWDTIFPFTRDYWIVKTDSLGIKQWDKDYGGTDNEERMGNINQTVDKGFLIAGSSLSPISGDKTENNLGPLQAWIVKTDSLGIKKWDKTLHTNSIVYDESGYAVQTRDECFAMANYTRSGQGGDKTQPNWDTICNFGCTADYWIIKFCDSTLTTGVANFQPPPDGYRDSGFQIIPNPANESFQVSGFGFPVKKIEIFNLLGETIFSAKPETLNFKLQTLNFPSGIYIIKAYTEKGVFQQKLVINH